MRYIPSSVEERTDMLESLGLDHVDELFRAIPERLRLTQPLDIPPAMAEADLLRLFTDIASRNTTTLPTFLGAGVYDHYCPVFVDQIVLRSEWYTAYTPYQPEMSQGTLQAIFEFQTMVCQLTGMEVANASLYDGSTALAEAALMALRVNKGRTRVVLASSVHPHYRAVVATYLKTLGVDLVIAGYGADGRLDLEAAAIDRNTAAVVVQSPNFFGCVEDLDAIGSAAHDQGALFVVGVAEGASLGILRAPGDAGADIVCGEGQSFGIPMSFGGPFLGLFATRERFIRQMPGRLVGRANDDRGNRGFVLTLSTREQHIRRERATSNICTNQGLFMLIATIYLSAMGRAGMREIAEQNLQKAHYAAKQIASLDGYSLRFASPFFNEFTVRVPGNGRALRDRLVDSGVIAGMPLDRYYPELGDSLVIAVTETASRENIDLLVERLAGAY